MIDKKSINISNNSNNSIKMAKNNTEKAHRSPPVIKKDKDKDIFTDHEFFKKIIDECEKLRWKKVNDYGLTYNEYGLIGLLVKIADKSGRIKRLHNKKFEGITPNFENIRDSLVDLVNYSIMAIMEVDRDTSRSK